VPTYQYACRDCDHAFEQVQSFSDASLTDCPQCEGRLRKVFNAVGVVFKGSGFYRTDSRSTEKGSSGNGSGDSAPGSSSEKSSGADSGASSASSSGSAPGSGSSSSSSESKSSSKSGSAA